MSEVIYRSFVPDLEVRSKSGDGRTVVGIAVPYNSAQRIDSKLTEQFARGAFNRQLNAFNRIPFTRNHKAHGGTIIGKTLLLRDDAAGLYGEWYISKTLLGDETLELLKDGALTDLSIGFRERQNRTVRSGIVERVTAELREVAVVDEGAYGEAATVEDVRSVEDRLSRLEQAQQILAGFPVLPSL